MKAFPSPRIEIVESLGQGTIIPDFPLHWGLLESLFVMWQSREEHVVRVSPGHFPGVVFQTQGHRPRAKGFLFISSVSQKSWSELWSELPRWNCSVCHRHPVM